MRKRSRRSEGRVIENGGEDYISPYNLIEGIGRNLILLIEEMGNFTIFLWKTLFAIFLPPFKVRMILRQFEFIGVYSLTIILITGLFTGMVFALQSTIAFKMFNAEGLIGATVGLSLVKELSPVFTSLMVTARAGSSIATEIGTMRVTEQIDALETMAVDPYNYLIAPKVIASTICVPLLAMLFSSIGIAGAYWVAVLMLKIDRSIFIDKLNFYVNPDDIWNGLLKALVFGLLIGIISCYKGFFAKGGAEGVGRATTGAVVFSSVSILISDYFLTRFLMGV